MKAKLVRLSGTLEIEGTASEIAAVVKALELPVYPSVNVPSVFGPNIPVTLGQFSYHVCRYPENWNSVSPPSCLDCGAQMGQYTAITCNNGMNT